MVKRKRKKGPADKSDFTLKSKEVDQDVLKRAVELELKAMDLGVLTTKKPEVPDEVLRVPSELYEECNGASINNKGRSKKKVLLVFPMILKPTSFGQVGTLSKLDTLNPEFYVDFPKKGRLAYLGTHVYSMNKYIHLSYPIGGGREMQCGGVVNSVIVFSDYEWRGTMEENPEQTLLTLPDFMIQAAEEAQHSTTKVKLDRGKELSTSDSDVELVDNTKPVASYKVVIPDESDEDLEVEDIELSSGTSSDEELVFAKMKQMPFSEP